MGRDRGLAVGSETGLEHGFWLPDALSSSIACTAPPSRALAWLLSDLPKPGQLVAHP